MKPTLDSARNDNIIEREIEGENLGVVSCYSISLHLPVGGRGGSGGERFKGCSTNKDTG